MELCKKILQADILKYYNSVNFCALYTFCYTFINYGNLNNKMCFCIGKKNLNDFLLNNSLYGKL